MTRPLRLLHIDDDDDIRAIVALALARDPAIFVTATASASAALDWVRAGQGFDAVLLDVTMPEMPGPALLRALHQVDSALPAIFMTAQSRAHELVALYAAGATGVIVKPFDPLTLVAQVRALLP